MRPEDIRDVARRVMRPERLSVTVVGALGPTLSRKVEKIVTTFAEVGSSEGPRYFLAAFGSSSRFLGGDGAA